MQNHVNTDRNGFRTMQDNGRHFIENGRLSAFEIFRLVSSTCVAVAFLAFVAVSTNANAYTKRFGDVTVQVDATVSFGTSIRVEDRDTNLLPAANGGSLKDQTVGVDPVLLGGVGAALPGLVAAGVLTQAEAGSYIATRTVGEVIAHLGAIPALAGVSALLAASHSSADAATQTALMSTPIGGVCGSASAVSQYARLPNTSCMFDNTGTGGREVYNYDAGINNDDGRLNFDQGDLTGATAKAITDLEVRSGPYKFFTRFTAFYDFALASNSSFERAGVTDEVEDQLVHDFEILDLYFSLDTELAGLPFHLRIGNQVINWGEATFILGGNSVFNPIDVAAFRRPGSEIKEALLPVEAIYASLALPADLTLEAYYGGWKRFEIDPAGSPFSTADFVEPGSADNGFRTYVGSGVYSGGNRRNCTPTAADPIAGATEKIYRDAINGVLGACPAGSLTEGFLHYGNALRDGHIETSRQSYRTITAAGGVLEDRNFLRKIDDDWSNGSDNYGIALRWYSEDLGSTEFSFYYQNYASRIPYVSTIAYQPVAAVNTVSPNASSTLRGATLLGCVGVATAQITAGSPLRTFAHGAYLGTTQIADPLGLAKSVREAIFGPADTTTGFTLTPTGGYTGAFANPARADAILDAAAARLVARLQAAPNTPSVAVAKASLANIARNAIANTDPAQVPEALRPLTRPDGSFAQALEFGCIDTLAQTNAGGLLTTGSSSVISGYETGVFNEYPEDIDLYGFSFNTTLGGWGIQGEATYRPNMPLQLDVTALAIAALGASCAWENFSAAAGTFRNLQTIPTNCGDWNTPFKGYVREEVYHFNLGTTATFTRSNPGVAALGADLAILLTEVGVVHVPDVDYYNQSNNVALAEDIPRFANQCTSGSDLPLGGVFALDPRGPLTATNALDGSQPATMCRPTPTSWGIVVVGQLQYNNAGGSALTVRPTIAYSRGIEGRTPGPAGSFRKDVYSLAMSVGLEYQSTWRASFGYTAFGGPRLYSGSVDRDYVSMSFSYAFE